MEFEVPRHVINGVTFNSYSSDEIIALSVKEIKNPQTFDNLLHPTSGGLYDPALGPNEREERCRTCGLSQIHCPGHMGHIRLPIPMYNPVFFNILCKLLKGTCFECHRLSVHSINSAILIQKLTLLEHGLLPLVDEVSEYVIELQENLGDRQEDRVIQMLQERVEKRIQEKADDVTKTPVKNIEACRNQLKKEFIKKMFHPKNCVHCKKKIHKVRQSQQSKILISSRKSTSSKESTKKTKKKNTNEEKENGSEDDSDSDEGDEEDEKQLSGSQKFLTSADAQEHLRRVWQHDGPVLKCLFSALQTSTTDYPTDIFFVEIIPVPPSRFRPLSCLGEKKFENSQTLNLTQVLSGAALVRQILTFKVAEKDGKTLDKQVQPTSFGEVQGKTLTEKLHNAWIQLQMVINCIYDGEKDKLAKAKVMGVKQILEKKEGLFRKNMMGKRVNFAARSVISPDPCISTNEIGIPEVFAKKLTFPQPVTPWNVHELRRAVINGPDMYPGASFVEVDGNKKVLGSNLDQRKAVAKELLTPSQTPHASCKVVHRHLKNGDVLLLNRQPTLHRPSIQAHKARVLPGEKTLRLHYANCKAYNADFDGDEMNAHFPQSELARAEAYTIACTDFQYLVPKDGKPLAGLIQDHMVSGVALTIRGRFFNRQNYCQLVYMALVDKRGPIKLLPPAMIKPCKLWSGKQVISTLMMNIIPEGKKLLNLEGKSKITEKSWQQKAGFSDAILDDMGESHVIIRGSELLCGVLDKGHYGNTPYGLVHCCYELYGGEVAGTILSCLARLFMSFLQHCRSFSLGVEDILVTPKADRKRQRAIKRSTKCGPAAAAKALGIEDPTKEELVESLMDVHFDKNDRRMRELDMCMKSQTDDTQNNIVGACMPKGLEKLFPANNLQLMVQSGAKGSTVNCMQISGLLGQIELEGRRPPLTLSGKTLPAFKAYDTSPRAGGFVSGRFLTGIRPQEYFFHCMAGREGLIDTAVKTSRSGYLQRCLIKHLEGLMVNYDLTVRDSDGSIVQFYYGEDGLDILKTGFLTPKQFPFLIENNNIEDDDSEACHKKVKKVFKKIEKWKKINKEKKRVSPFAEFSKQNLDNSTDSNTGVECCSRTPDVLMKCQHWRKLDQDVKQGYVKKFCRMPDPVNSVYRPFQYSGVVPENIINQIENFTKTQSHKLDSCGVSKKSFRKILCDKTSKSLAQPGEAVGLLCAQSIGEPSTQMTLNTFHFAGRGEMNVTLGIPRLVELLMVASDNIKTPSMDIPVLDGCQTKARILQATLNKVHLSEVLQKVRVTELLSISDVKMRHRKRIFQIHFKFLHPKYYKDRLSIAPSSILQFMERMYVRSLLTTIRKKFRYFPRMRLTTHAVVEKKMGHKTNQSEEDHLIPPNQSDDEDDLSDMELHDNSAADAKERQKRQEEQEYDGPDLVDENSNQYDDVQLQMDNVESEVEEEDEEIEDSHKTSYNKESAENRIKFVVETSSNVKDYKFDQKKELWCEFTLQFGILNSKIDLPSLVEEHAKTVILRSVPGINRCLLHDEKDGKLHIKTEGINILEMYGHTDMLDLNQLYSNDIHAIARTYGIEAANKVIIKEIKNVFAAYGIEVDYRHLSLLADYMTFEGSYKPFNRMAIESCSSALQQMSFETTMSFVIKASINGAMDKLKSPSSQIVAGKHITCGSGSFDLLQRMN